MFLFSSSSVLILAWQRTRGSLLFNYLQVKLNRIKVLYIITACSPFVWGGGWRGITGWWQGEGGRASWWDKLSLPDPTGVRRCKMWLFKKTQPQKGAGMKPFWGPSDREGIFREEDLEKVDHKTCCEMKGFFPFILKEVPNDPFLIGGGSRSLFYKTAVDPYQSSKTGLNYLFWKYL